MNKTAWEQAILVMRAAALYFVAFLVLSLLPFNNISISLAPAAWAQSGTSSDQQTAPFLPEVLTHPTQTEGPGGPIVSAPSTTPLEKQLQSEVATQPTQTEGPGPLVSAPSTTGGQAPAPGETTFVDVVHGGISHGILATATWFDSFFGDKRSSELNPSYIRFRYNVFVEKGSKTELKPDLNARFVLPQLREKTHLVISGSPKEENEFSAVQSHNAADPSSGGEDRNVTTALHYSLLESLKTSFTVRAGLKFKPNGVDYTAGPVYRVTLPFRSGWNLRFIEDIAWRSALGWRHASTLDLERQLPHDLFFRTSTEWVHTEHAGGFIYAFSCSISQPLSSHAALQYSWVNVFQTQPINELTEVALRVSYRQRIWRDWLYYEVMPQYRFPRDRRFEATPGILFRLDMLFGSITS